ncbi:hypothetical protein [Bradyrhizobium sp. STM 3562]|uniref:hypothetical protein n=1 Tax=Bradyrhizobium sp. STM 3562 TaxID=578924 RepID=UPI00388E5ED3
MKPDNKFPGARQATRRNQAWAVDIAMLDLGGSPLVTLVIDVHTRCPLSATVSPTISGAVTDGLDRLVRSFERPEAIWVDYVHDHASFPFMTWADRHGISLIYGVLPRAKDLTQAALRDLGAHLHDKHFATLIELGDDIERWRKRYAPTPRAFPAVTNGDQ